MKGVIISVVFALAGFAVARPFAEGALDARQAQTWTCDSMAPCEPGDVQKVIDELNGADQTKGVFLVDDGRWTPLNGFSNGCGAWAKKLSPGATASLPRDMAAGLSTVQKQCNTNSQINGMNTAGGNSQNLVYVGTSAPPEY